MNQKDYDKLSDIIEKEFSKEEKDSFKSKYAKESDINSISLYYDKNSITKDSIDNDGQFKIKPKSYKLNATNEQIETDKSNYYIDSVAFGTNVTVEDEDLIKKEVNKK